MSLHAKTQSWTLTVVAASRDVLLSLPFCCCLCLIRFSTISMMFGLGMQAQAIFDGIEKLCSKRDELNRQIQQEEEEKGRLQHDIHVLTEKLRRVNESLARRHSVRADFDHTIGETEGAFIKILESCQTLLSVIKKEAGNLGKATEPGRKDH
ncbi:Sjoegren syndrome nuclear autoantigen 1-like isoform X1 [Oncorhynchus tshawytscha]|uniref:Sjogren syndrome nuclear autoantigen 1 n=2 Tax=Oncorhynchus tshawytscha TaxID=74940 RepID=A0AAZ3SFB0_ONCTS|nr:Sjoegren syndrome nuclear autoantigen 1-like isoform X1 [Oncorhynchus tshawytscha]